MRTVKLNTGVIITFDKFDNMISVKSPYVKGDPIEMTALRYYVNIIKEIIKN